MHFGKEYSALLSTLPQELAASAVDYRQLKKVINTLVHELESLGLGPSLLHSLQSLTDSDAAESVESHNQDTETRTTVFDQVVLASQGVAPRKVAYELLLDDQSTIQSRLRIWVPFLGSAHLDPSFDGLAASMPSITDRRLLWNGSTDSPSSSSEPWISVSSNVSQDDSIPPPSALPYRELVIPLAADLTFFDLLASGLGSMTEQSSSIRQGFIDTLNDLSREISRGARPSHLSTRKLFSGHEGDLYTWRDIFATYMEVEVFESNAELDRGDRPVEESEARLQLFLSKVSPSGVNLSKAGQGSLEKFLQLNMYLLSVKKFYLANSEATRKILKKHAKRTALPQFSQQTLQELIPSMQRESTPLPHILVLAIAEVLLPVIPHISDYECLICMNIAYKPIRLDCGHFFCVRCLVKMQRRRDDHCPLCRAQTVVTADKRNVDNALSHLMNDFFPRETKEKQRLNDEELAKEELQDLSLRTDGCVVQ